MLPVFALIDPNLHHIGGSALSDHWSDMSLHPIMQSTLGMNMIEPANSREFVDNAAALVEAARRAGADAADAVVVRSRSTGVSVRLGKVEATESSESDDFSLRVFVGRKVASISATAGSDPKILAERAVAMARVSPDDAFEGLADPANLVRTIRDLDLYDPTVVAAARLTEDALAAEAAALEVDGVTNSGGASASAGLGGMVLVTSMRSRTPQPSAVRPPRARSNALAPGRPRPAWSMWFTTRAWHAASRPIFPAPSMAHPLRARPVF
jgi:PmbA/TldA metallopeptidase domain 1